MEWQPIETAPKDKPIWCYNGGQGMMIFLDIEDFQGFVWNDDLLSDVDPNPEQPTHWMPLPDPPKGER